MKRRDSILQNYYMSKLPKAQGGLTAPSTPTTPKSSSTMDFTGSAGTVNPTATTCPENYEFDQSTGQCRPIITLSNVNIFSPRKYGQITQNLGPGLGQFTYRGNLATGAPKQSMNDFSKPIIGRGLPGLDRQIRMGDLLANNRIASNEQIARNFQIEQQIRARDIENNYNILRNTPGLKLYSDQELQRYAQQSKDKWPKFVQQNFDEESNTIYNVVNHPDYNPSVPVSSQRNLAADNSLRTMFLRGRNKMFGEFDRMNPVVGTALKILASPGSSAANLMFDQQNRYLNPNQSVGQNLLNLGLDVASVAPIPVAQGVGTGLKTAVTTAGKYLNAPLTIGSRVFPSVTAGNLLAAYGASDFLVNRAPQIPGQIARGQYGEAALNTTLGTLDLVGANMVSPSLVNNAFRLANQGRQYLSSTYRNIAEGDNIFNYAWRSPAAGITDDVALGMYQQTRNSIPLDASARNVISDYQHTSGPFTGRFESGNVNLVKRLDLENAIAERNLLTQSGKPNVLIRRFDPDNPELYSLNESGQLILNRPTSWSVGRGWDYTSKPNRIVFKLPSGSRGMLNEYNAAKFDQDVSKLMVEKEAILGSGLNLGKRLGKVKNEFGGYDYIHRFEGYKPTEWDDIRRLNTENIGEIVDLNKNIAAGGNFNLGVYPFFKNPNILLKLGKVSQNEQFGLNNRNVVTGIPELLREMPTEAWGKIAIPFREINMSGLTSQTLNRPVIPNSEILGSIMQRAKGKPLSEYSVSDLENIQPWDYQDLANSVKNLANKGVSVDFYGDNFLLNKTDYGRNQFNLFDIGLLPNTNTGSFPVGPLYGLDAKAFSQGINRIDPKMIKSILQEKMRRAVYESASKAGEGAYSDQEIFDAIQRINDRIQRADIKYKKGGPIVNQRGFMDGAPPKGSNWRIMGDGRGTSITMDLPDMPDEILVVPDGEFEKAEVIKKGEDKYFMGADFVDEYLLQNGGGTKKKKKTLILAEEPLLKKQGEFSREYKNPFEIEAQKIKKYVNQYFPDEEVEIIPAYGKEFTEGLKKSDPNTRLVFLAHHGDNLFGIPADEVIGTLSRTPYENCYAGTCYGTDLHGVGEFNRDYQHRVWEKTGSWTGENPITYQGMDRAPESYDLKNFYLRRNHIPWLGFSSVGRGGEEGFRDSFFRITQNPIVTKLFEALKDPNISRDEANALWKRIEKLQKANAQYIAEPKGADYGKLNVVPYPMRTKNYPSGPIGIKNFKQLGGNALGMLRDYGAGISVPPKYQERPGTVITPEEAASLKFMKDWTNSPMAKQMLYNSFAGSSPIPFQDAEKMQTERMRILGDTKFLQFPNVESLAKSIGLPNERILGTSLSADNVGPYLSPEKSLVLYTNRRTPALTSQTITHETSHSSDAAGRLIPMSDIRKMQTYAGLPLGHHNSTDPDLRFKSYVAHPSETRARLNSIRHTAKKQGLYDPFTQKATPEVLRQLINPSNPNQNAELLELYKVYGVDEILDMLNSISMTPNQGLPQAKSGGQHGGLDRWFAEKWVDVKTGKPCGRQEGENRAYPACRPSKRVSSKTPKTSSELSSAEKEKFKRSKTSSERIPYSHKRRK